MLCARMYVHLRRRRDGGDEGLCRVRVKVFEYNIVLRFVMVSYLFSLN